MHQLADRIAQDRAFYIAIAAFMLATFATAMALGDLRWFIPGVYFLPWIRIIPGLLALCLIVTALQAMRTDDPIGTLRARIFAFVSLRLAGILLFTCMAIFHGTFTSMKSMLPELHPFTFDPFLASMDVALHGQQPWRYLQLFDGMTEVVRFFYRQVWFLLLGGITFAMCLARPGKLRSQYIWTFMFCWVGLGIVVAGTFMSAGPIYYDRLLQADRFAELTARLQSLRTPTIPTTLYADLLWESYTEKIPGLGSGISAFPSLHLAMSTLFALTAMRVGKLMGGLMLAYLVITMIGSVHLGWHYAVDGYVSIIATTAFWGLIGKALDRTSASPQATAGQRPQPPQRPGFGLGWQEGAG